MPRKYFRKYLPDHTSVREHRHLQWARPFLKHPNLWHLNRHSVAGGMAVGLLAGMIPGPVQMLTAAIFSILLHVNLPVALAATLLTNPFTWPFFIVAAYALGSWLTGESGQAVTEFAFDWQHQTLSAFLPALWDWLLSLGATFLIGNSVLAVCLALFGYGAVHLAWRLHVLSYLKRRKTRTSPQPSP